MTIKYFNPRLWIQYSKIALAVSCFLIATFCLWSLHSRYAMILAWASHHIFLLMCLAPILAAVLMFRFGMRISVKKLQDHSHRFIQALINQLTHHIQQPIANLNEVVSEAELAQLMTALSAPETKNALAQALINGQKGLLIVRKPLANSSGDDTGTEAGKNPAFHVIIARDVPRKMLIRFESNDGAAIDLDTSRILDFHLGLYLYPKSKLPGGTKYQAAIPHMYKTKKGIERKCEPILGISTQSNELTERVVISHLNQDIIAIEPNLGMSLQELFDRSHSFIYDNHERHLDGHFLRKSWFIETLSLDQVMQMLASITTAIQTYHDEKQRGHLDLAAKNIVVDYEGRATPIDFPDLEKPIVPHTPAHTVMCQQHKLFRRYAELLNLDLIHRLDQASTLYEIYSRPSITYDDELRSLNHSRPLLGHEFVSQITFTARYHDSWALLTVALVSFHHVTNHVVRRYRSMLQFQQRLKCYRVSKPACSPIKTYGYLRFFLSLSNEVPQS